MYAACHAGAAASHATHHRVVVCLSVGHGPACAGRVDACTAGGLARWPEARTSALQTFADMPDQQLCASNPVSAAAAIQTLTRVIEHKALINLHNKSSWCRQGELATR